MPTALFIKSYLKNMKRNEERMSIVFGALALLAGVVLLSNNLQKFKKRLQQPAVIPQNVEVQSFAKLPENVDLQKLPARYIVQQGDSSWSIAEAFYGNGFLYTNIEEANSLQPNQALEQGMTLHIPAVTQEEIQTKTASTSASPSTQGTKTHTTTPTDTLWKLAQQYYNDGYQWTKIYEANKAKISNPDKLEKGITLIIP